MRTFVLRFFAPILFLFFLNLNIPRYYLFLAIKRFKNNSECKYAGKKMDYKVFQLHYINVRFPRRVRSLELKLFAGKTKLAKI